MKNIVLYGGGNIAQAIIEGLIKSGYKTNKIFYIDRNIKHQKKHTVSTRTLTSTHSTHHQKFQNLQR